MESENENKLIAIKKGNGIDALNPAFDAVSFTNFVYKGSSSFFDSFQ